MPVEPHSFMSTIALSDFVVVGIFNMLVSERSVAIGLNSSSNFVKVSAY